MTLLKLGGTLTTLISFSIAIPDRPRTIAEAEESCWGVFKRFAASHVRNRVSAAENRRCVVE
jgi:hypothetical protein